MTKRFLNLNYRTLRNGQRLYYSFNHDEALLSWYYEKNKLNKGNFFLITIDAHIDWTDLVREELEELKKFKERQKKFDNNNEDLSELDDPHLQNLSELRKIIENSFRGDNVSFIVASMELGLIDNVLIISPNINDLRIPQTYEDMQGIQHKIYHIHSIRDLWYPYGRAVLNDDFNKEYREIQNHLKSNPYIVDFDLDYFTYSRDDKGFVINEKHFKIFFKDSNFYNLLSKASVITIALEPGCCGGVQNSAIIFYNITSFITNRLGNL